MIAPVRILMVVRVGAVLFGMIFTVTVAAALLTVPSFTLKVKVSEPFAFALGTFLNAPVAAFVMVTTPFVARVSTRYVNDEPISTSEPVSVPV